MSNDAAMLRAQHIERRVDELSSIERSRKRKLRELYAVASHSESPIPSFVNLDAPDSQAPEPERRFLEVNDIKKGSFHENTIPQRRNLRSSANGKGRGSTPTKGEDRTTANQNRLNALLSAQRDNRESLQERTKGDAGYNFGIPFGSPAKAARLEDGLPEKTQAETLRASPGRAQNPTALLDKVVDQTMNDVIETANVDKIPEEPAVPVNALEKENVINNVENTPELSNGVDPSVAIPRTADDAANLPGPTLNGDGDPNHSPAVVHLPSQEEQEQRLREQDERAEQKKREGEAKENTEANGKLTLQVPNVEAPAGHHDAVSSPGSSEAPLSATTANAHGSSADTSPDNEAHHYEPDAMDVDKPSQSAQDEPRTPPELAPTEEEVKEKEQHDSRLKAQIELVREKILDSSPVSADAQLLQEQAVAESASATPKAASKEPEETDGMNAETRELANGTENAQQMMEDEEEDQDEVIGVPTSGEEKATGAPEVSLANEPPIEEGEPKVVGGNRDALVVDEPAMLKESQVEVEKKEQTQARTPESMPAADTSKQLSSPKEPEPAAEAPAQPTPARTPPIAATTPPIERMTTRVASGALKHKSVSEILGETPRQSPASDKSRSGTSTPGSPAAKLRLKELAKEKERSKLSTVVFAKQPRMPLQNNGNGKAVATNTVADKVIGVDYPDYLMPVIQAQAYSKVRGFHPLEAMIASAHKTISTSNSSIPFQELQAQKIISRIHTLQSQDKWSLRQPKRAAEPNRPATHWDELLKEAKWMRTDFREERKWKMAFAKKVAHTCAMWVEGDAEERRLLERKVAEPKAKEEQMDDADAEIPHPTPDLVASSDNETPVDEFDDEPSISHLDAVAPTAIFSLDNDDLVFAMNRSPSSDKLLQELPIYGQPLQVHRSELPTSTFDPDASWRKPYLPISKFIEGKIILKDDAPPRKKSRFEYEYESDDEDGVVFGQADRKSKELPSDQIEVALFNPENRHLRERIHAGHQFRPPSEFPMPLQSFFENRYSSQWTWAEDDELKQLVREYQYNWSLISSMLASRSMYSSAAERRTPWECFERWINLEGLPADMVKTHYFRAYNNRIEAARRSLLHQAQIQAATPAPAPGSVATPARQIRRTTDSQRVERRRNSKHLNLIDAMRKVAKKRETALQKQQHAQNQANMRKQPDAAPQNMPKHTPQQISKLKHDRELQLQERLQRTIAQQEQARRNQAAAIRNPQNPHGWPIGPNGLPQQPRNMQGVPQTPGMGGVGRPNNLAVPVPNHLPHVPMQSMQPNTGQPGQMGMGVQGVPKMHPGMGQMPINGMPAAQMQGMQGMQGLQAQHNRLAVSNNANSPDINLVMQAQRIAQNQRAAVQMQQSGQHAGQTGAQMHQSPPNNMRPMPSMAANGQFIHSQTNPQSLAAQQAMHNFTNSPSNPQPPPNAQQQQHHGVGAAGSPRPAAAMAQIEANYRAKYPTATPDQIRKLVSDAVMLQQRQQLQQTAMHAAAGNQSNLSNMSTPTHATNAHAGSVGMGMGGVGGGLGGGHGAGQMGAGQMAAPSPMQGLATGMQNSPVQYAQMLRAQQERQAAAVAAAAAQAAAQQANTGQNNNAQQGQQNLGQGQQANVQHSAQSQSQSPAMMNRGPSQSQGTPQQSNLGLPQQNQQQNQNTPKQAHAQMSPPQQPQNLQNLQNQRMSPQMAQAGQAALQASQQQQQQHVQQQAQSQLQQLQQQAAQNQQNQAAQLQAQQNSVNTQAQANAQTQQHANAQAQAQQHQRSASAQSQGK